MKNCFLIVNCNDYKSTKHLVDNIKDYKCLDEILIVDNNSNQKEREVLSSIKGKNINIIYCDDNLGYSYAINIGTKYLIDKYQKCNFIISNSDIVIMSEEDLKTLIDALQEENVGIVGPQILELGSISRGFKFVSPLVDLFNSMPITKNVVPDRKIYYEDSYYQGTISQVDVISSAFFLICSDTMQKINFMDECVFLYYEDFILSKKIHDLNLRVLIVNSVKIKHLYSATVDKIIKNSEKFKLFKESQFYYHSTYNNANKLVRFIFNISKNIGLMIRKK